MEQAWHLENETSVKVSFQVKDDICFIAFSGKFVKDQSLSMQPEIEKFVSEQTSLIGGIINLAGVSSIDSTGIGILVSLFHVFNKRGLKFTLCCLTHKVQRIVDLIDLGSVIQIRRSEAAAILFVKDDEKMPLI